MTQNWMYTWVDVDATINRALGSDWPKWLLGTSAYFDGLVVTVKTKTSRESVYEALSLWFGPRYEREHGLLLDGSPEHPRVMPVFIEEGEEGQEPKVKELKPFFRDVAMLPTGSSGVVLPHPFPDNTPAILAFYSFKGGVGRTTHLIGFLRSLSERGLKALVIDADLEAPGLTYLAGAESSYTGTDFSFVDLLALAHSENDEGSEMALSSAAHALKRQTLSVRINDQEIDHFILPAFRSDEQSLSIDIRPEHLVSGADRHWAVAELLGELGRRLDVDVVLVDLRAGLSELASPILFDPRVQRFLITTPGKQSVQGTKIVLGELAKVAPISMRDDLYDPSVIISFVLQDVSESEFVSDIITSLYHSYPQDGEHAVGADSIDLPRIEIEQTSFAQELLYLSSMTDALSKVQNSNICKVASRLTVDISSRITITTSNSQSAVSYDSVRKTLESLATDVEFAESGRGDKFLRIAPLRALARQFQDTVPTAVVVGNKGAGKTYTCLQVVRSGKWSRFVERVWEIGSVTVPSAADDVLIWPLFQSTNLKAAAKDIVDACRKNTADELGIIDPMGSIEAEDAIRESLRETLADETWWRHRWFTIIAKSLRLPILGENDSAGRVLQYLREKQKRLLIVIDGLEDLFPALQSSPNQQTALRALLQGIPNYLRESPNSPLGALIFVRADLVKNAIPQNTGQFLRLYAPFSLRWSEEEALRLAVWLCQTAGLSFDRLAETLTIEQARAFLVSVWGLKLGPDSSREARSAEWVIAALSDFRGQIQARDLVRFFRYAAADSRNAGVQDRLLAPRSVRDAITPCSKEKIEEIVQEIDALREIFPKLQQATNKRIPFDAASSGVTVAEIRFLEDIGVVIEDRGEYFMPEIFRLGLGFQLSQGARPRVLTLARRALSQ